jgi:hypothetical protein
MRQPVSAHAAALTPPSASERKWMMRDQFRILGDLLNQHTFRHIRALGAGAGWRCWEAGAGGAGVPKWLAERVGPSGYVLASDVDISVLDDTRDRPFDVRRHDLTTDPPPTGGFDLVHARLVLNTCPTRLSRWPYKLQRCAPKAGCSWKARIRSCSPSHAPTRSSPGMHWPTSSEARCGSSWLSAPKSIWAVSFPGYCVTPA